MIKLLWYDDYYDGPLSGVCRYNNKFCYYHYFSGGFSISSDGSSDYVPRVFQIRELRTREFIREYFSHIAFKLFIGQLALNWCWRIVSNKNLNYRYHDNKLVGAFSEFEYC